MPWVPFASRLVATPLESRSQCHYHTHTNLAVPLHIASFMIRIKEADFHYRVR
jgi:hypothetical protein